ncbi:MAG: T9SS type A sorting domain-containing protein [Bacteroidota bacterium]
MKTCLLFVAILFLFCTGGLAQTTLLTEDWETAAVGQTPPAGWGIDLVSGTNYTYFQSAGTYPTCTPFSGSRFVEFDSFDATSGTSNRLKRTTAVSTVGYSVVTVDFEWLVDPGYTNNDNVMVQWSTDGSTWNNSTSFSRYGATQQWVLESVTLPYAAANIPTLYVALLFTSAYGNNCHLDLLHVKASAGPNITYTPFGNTSQTTARTLTASLVAPAGVPTSGAGLPRLYWKINSGTWTSATGAFVSGSTYTFSFGAGVATGNVVSYYIVAQDMNATPNVTCAPSAGAAGLTANPPAASTPPASPSTYTIIGALCGNYNVGVGQSYTTITAALADLAVKEVTCPVTFSLTDNSYSETLPLLVYPFAGASATNTVTIKPAAGKTPVISGSSTTGVIVFYGCSYVILDGSNSGGSDKSMTWENTNTAASTYSVGIFNDGTNGASNCTVKNCLIRASSQVANTTYALILNYSGGGYNNIVINNNTIYSANYGMQFAGVAGNPATNGQITNNIFGSTVDAQAIQLTGMVLTYCDNTLIQGNEIMGAALGNANYTQSGIYLSTACTNTKIKQNKIHDWYYTGTGGRGNYGIYFGTGDATTPTEISNNLIYNIKADGNSTGGGGNARDVWGMYFTSGGNVKLYHNNINLTGSVTSATTANYSACICIQSGCSLFDLQNNILKNSLQPVSGTPASKTFAVFNAGTAAMWTTINYNDYYVNGIGPNIGYQSSARATLAAWQTATTQDANSLNIDPAFISATDLHPTATGLMKTGTFLPAVPVDYTGAGRTTPPDIGAFQFSANPVVTTTAATAVTLTSATLNGSINPNNASVTTGFEYGLTTAYGTAVTGAPVSVSGSVAMPVSSVIVGLLPCTLYHFRATGVSGALTVNGGDLTFTTLNASPVATPVAATSVTSTTATLNGTVNANNLSSTVTFDYGLTVAYGTTVPGVPSPVTGSSATAVSAAITGLLPGTTYHFRVNGTNSCGTTNSADMTVTTPALAPSVVTVAATLVTTSSATLNGTILANGASTAVFFDYGLTVAYGTTVAGTPGPVTGNTVTPVSAAITGLTTGTTYHFRVRGTNSIGTTNGNDLTFITGCPVPGAAGTVTGPASVCQNGTGYVYTVPVIANATTYNWTLPAGTTITAGNGTNSITVSFSGTATSGNVSVVGSSICGNGTVSPNLAVTVNPQPVPTVTGPGNLCAGAMGNVYTTQAGMTGYIWTLSPGGTITAGVGTNSIMVNWNAAGAQSVCVNYTNTAGCTASTPGCYNVTINALPVPTITGPSSVCMNSAGNVYTTQSGMTGYTWTVSAGGLITAGSTTNAITVTWSTTGAKTVTVNYTNANSCTAATPASYAVTVNALPAPAITGTAILCQGATGVVYTTQAGMTNYVWTASSGGIITAGGTAASNTMTVTWNGSGAQTVCVNYTNANGCTAAAAVCFNVQVNPTPTPTIGSNNAPCVGSTGNMYYTEGGMTGYVWAVSTGGTIVSGQGTSAINVTWTGVGAQWVSVNYTGTTGCSAATPSIYNLFVNPMPNAAGAITGTATLCAGTNGVAYSCAEILNASSYTWTLPAGATIATGAGTRNITVNFGVSAVSGNITVSGTNSCGNGTASPAYAVTVNPLPAAAGTITGPASVCVGSTGVAYSVPAIANATTYVWTVPAGATITSGGTTRNIVVSYGTAAGTGTVTVKGTNTCGNGTAATLNVTMNAIPGAPVVTVSGNVLTSSAASGNQWYYSGNAIAGATGQTYTVTHNTGYYWCVVTTNGCSSPVSNKVWVVVTGVQELQNSNFSVYPVPNDGRFTVSITSPVQENYSIEVYNQLGAKIYELGDVTVNGTFEKQLDLRPVSNGIYSVVFLNSEHKVVKKLLVNK